MLCNNMKNITKTTKTILFASLIAALVLPFSAMDFANAEPPKDVLTKIEEKMAEIKDKKDKQSVKQYQNLDLVKSIEILKQKIDKLKSINANSKAIESLELKFNDKVSEFMSKYSVNNVEYMESSDGTTSVSYITPVHTSAQLWATQISRSNCSAGSSNSVDSGSITPASNSATINQSWNTSSSISDGYFPNCTTKSYSYGWINYADVLGFDGCTSAHTSNTGSSIGNTCSKIKDGDIVVITTQEFYDNTTKFGSEGWFVLWL